MPRRNEIRNGHLYGLPAQRIDVRCAHGESTFLLLPGSEPGSNAAAIDVLTGAHGIKRSCHCADQPAEAREQPSPVVATRMARSRLANAQS